MYAMIIMGAMALPPGYPTEFETQALCDNAADVILHQVLPPEQAMQTKIMCVPQGNIYPKRDRRY